MCLFYNIPFPAAKCNGVRPWISPRLTFAPLPINNSTSSLLPEQVGVKKNPTHFYLIRF